MILKHDLGKSIELTNGDRDLPLWRYVYGGLPKPCFHPLCTPSGHCLTNFEPTDHVWHRGLWFTIKYINGENFWEEHPPFGVQWTQAPPTVSHEGDGSINFDTSLAWERPDGMGIVFTETRRFVYVPIDNESYAIDFAFALTARDRLLLDRTPFTTWGGYGGLILRGTRNWIDSRLLFADGSTSDRPAPVHSPWVDLSGKLDGGRDITGGAAIFDHPDNPRHPTPWYGATGAGHYINAAFLFEETMQLEAGETLALKYRVLVHNGIPDVGTLQNAYDQYLRKS